MAKPEEAERVRNAIKPVKELYDLGKWIIHTEEVLKKVKDLATDKILLETLIGDKIMCEEMKRWFTRGNEVGTSSGMEELKRYLETADVKKKIIVAEREFVQLDIVSGNKRRLIIYVEKKYNLIIAKESIYRADEVAAWPLILPLIRMDMCAEDQKLLNPLVIYDSKEKFIFACETLSSLETMAREEVQVVASVRTQERKRESK